MMATDAERIGEWVEVFSILQDTGLTNRASRYALALSSLQQKLEAVQLEIDAVKVSESKLIEAARKEVEAKSKRRKTGRSQDHDLEAGKAFASQLRETVLNKAQYASTSLQQSETPFAGTQLASEALVRAQVALQAAGSDEAAQPNRRTEKTI
mmetsp:Transcript_41661/g.89449  ORF Transcript_41661/g.89449 Transcript_41661/m.89449 type:complete len:153 (+) Transcript_41661:93-551(+)